MTEMVERLAQAMCRRWMEEQDKEHGNRPNWKIFGSSIEDAVDKEWHDLEADALVAIAAMREPTEAMRDAGFKEQSEMGDIAGIWRTMIDAALR